MSISTSKKVLILASVLCPLFQISAMENAAHAEAVVHSKMTQLLEREQQSLAAASMLTEELNHLAENTKHQLATHMVLGSRPREDWLTYNNLERANDKLTFKCYPFIKGTAYPAGTNLVIVGDVHGNSEALDMILGFVSSNREAVAPRPHYVFLGDYVDRWRKITQDSDDTITYQKALNFYNANPEMVTMLRGNHEDLIALIQFSSFRENRCIMPAQGVPAGKRCQANPLLYQIATSYEFLPSAFFVGCHSEQKPTPFLQLCHGGIEPSLNPQALLVNAATETQTFYQFTTDVREVAPPQPWATRNGLLWNSFSLLDHTEDDRRHHSVLHGLADLENYLANASAGSVEHLCGVWGGHQHYDDMLVKLAHNGGLATLWEGRAHVLVSAYQELPCISFSVVTLAENAEGWMLTQYTHHPAIDAPGHFASHGPTPLFEYLRAH